jgi:signal peptidase I
MSLVPPQPVPDNSKNNALPGTDPSSTSTFTQPDANTQSEAVKQTGAIADQPESDFQPNAENIPPANPVHSDLMIKGSEIVVNPSRDGGSVRPVTPIPQQPENPWIEGIKTIGLSIVLALGIRQFVAEARFIPSESMVPTLEINDRLIVEKISYYFQNPQRGDIVVFWPTEKLKQENPSLKDAFIKRVIGLPGEEVEVKDGLVFINGEALDENYIAAAPDYQWGPERISDDSYLVLGDNRNNSYDSHFWGYVPRENIIGRAVVRFWPPNRIGTIGPEPPYQEKSLEE